MSVTQTTTTTSPTNSLPSPNRQRRRLTLRKSRIVPVKSETEVAAEKRRVRNIVWRDCWFLMLALIGTHFMTYVELHASEAELRGGEAAPSGVVDTGFILTQRLYEFLKNNQKWNDILAAINSLALFVPGFYTGYITLFKGNFDLAFRYMATHLLRSFCGWFTYLPPDPTYLPSNYDFPDIWQCVLVKDCSITPEPEVMPFVSFFSGHVCTMTTTANHMYTHGHKRLGLMCHFFNAFQIVRLLATRGHYSIDMIIAWYVAVYVSNTAGRLGRYYSRGKTLHEVMPGTAEEVFETVTGTWDVKQERRISRLLKKEEVRELFLAMEDDEDDIDLVIEECTSETTLSLAAEGKVELVDLTSWDSETKKSN